MTDENPTSSKGTAGGVRLLTDPAATDDRPRGFQPWLVVILLMPVALLNYLDRQMMASMQSSVMESIPSLGEAPNREELWGFMLGQFKWVYAVFSLIGGYLADRFSRRWTICGSLFVWSAVTWWTGQVTTYQELLWARSLMGVSEAFYIPAALALIAEVHVGATRSRAVGLHQMAIYCGVILGGFGGYVAAHPEFGWRWAFVNCGLLGMVYALPLVALLRDPRGSTASAGAASGESASARSAVGGAAAAAQPTAIDQPWSATDTLPAVVGAVSPITTLHVERKRSEQPSTTSIRRFAFVELLLNPAFVLLVLYFTLPAMAGWVVRDWMPSILKKEFRIGQGAAGVAATLYWQVAAIVGVSVGGWLADRSMRTHPRGRIYVSAAGMTMIAVAILWIGFAPTLELAIAGLIVFGLGWGAFDCNNMPILAQLVRPQLRATGYGVMNFVSISCGGLADWGFGRLRDAQVPLAWIFGVLSLLGLLSVGLVLAIRPRPELMESAANR